MNNFLYIITKLFQPMDYLRIRHPEKKIYDVFIPLILTALTLLVVYVSVIDMNLLGDGGFVSIFTNLLQILTGFYIASLAAVATFDKDSMDTVMPGDPVVLIVERLGSKEEEDLTRRRFLSLMFGYLSLLSFVIYFIGAFAQLLSGNLENINPIVFEVIKLVSISLYSFLVANLMVTTLLGLFYMTDRIHRR